MHAVHVRAFLARHPRTHRGIVIVLALAAGGLVASRSAAAGAARDAWGERRAVWTVATDTAAGDALAPDAVRSIEVPLGVVPDGAIEQVSVDALARHDLRAGSILTDVDVATADELLGADRRGVAVPADDTTLPVVAGQQVDVVALGRVVAAGGVVTEVRATVVVVAVDESVAAEVAAAVLDRTASLVRSGG